MPIAPWLQVPNYLGAMQAGAGLGLQIREQNSADARAAAALRNAEKELFFKAQQAEANRQLQEQELAVKQQNAMAQLQADQQKSLMQQRMQEAGLIRDDQRFDLAQQRQGRLDEASMTREQLAAQREERLAKMALLRLDLNERKADQQLARDDQRAEGLDRRAAEHNDLMRELADQRAAPKESLVNVRSTLPDGSVVTRKLTADQADQLGSEAYVSLLKARNSGAGTGQLIDGVWKEGESGMFNRNKPVDALLESAAAKVAPDVRDRLQEKFPEPKAIALPAEDAPVIPDDAAARIREEYRAGKISRDEAKKRLNELGLK